MSAAAIIQQLESLPVEDQRVAFAHLQAHDGGATGSANSPAFVASEGFKKPAGEAFSRNDALFRKLAQ